MKNKYANTIKLLTSNDYFYINPGLKRIKQFLSIIDNPQDKLKYIHVAGSNGKGSVCAILNALLQKNKLKIGLYTSPHIFEYTERIRINNKSISKKFFVNLVEFIIETAKKNNIQLTEFEILTVAAFKYFEEKKVDIAILETGLGGRFDATNIIKENLCSIITHIDLEHTDRLGCTIEEISFEKAGIIKKNCPVIIGEKNSIIEKIASEKQAELIYAEKTDKQCSLKCLCQKDNLALALKAINILGYKFEDKDLMNIKNPCRFEYLTNYNIIIDVAHNPNGIDNLRKTLDKIYPEQNFNFIFGCLKTKNYKKMLDILIKKDDILYVYEFSHPNSCKYSDLQKVVDKDLLKFSDYKQNNNITVICGSFYMLKELFTDMGIKYDKNKDLY